MFNIVLVEPEIPPNTGNIIRLCANTGCSLHLVHPLGFEMSEKQLRRAGLDYADMTRVSHYDSFANFAAEEFGLHKPLQANHSNSNQADKTPTAVGFQSAVNFQSAVCFSTKGTTPYHKHRFKPGEWLLFGSETRGLDNSVLQQFSSESVLRMPMLPGSRSMNLSNTVAVAVFEAWRQCDFVES